MKVFIVTKEPFPNGLASTKRITCYAKGLLLSGIPCKVLIATRTEIYGEIPKNSKSKGLLYRYIGGTPLRASNIFIRLLNDYLDIFKTLFYILKNTSKDDVILNYLREDKLNSLILIIAKISKAKVIRELCEYPYGVKKENSFLKLKRKIIINFIFPKYDGFICISQALFNLAEQYKSPHSKLIKVPIMVDPDEKEISSLISPIDTPYIFHSGTLYEQKDGIIGTFEAFAIASQKLDFPIKYVLTGSLLKSPDRFQIKNIIKKYSIQDKVIFTGFLTKEELSIYQKSCVLMIINKLDNQQNKYCFATKLGDYLLSGKPIITTTIGESTNYLKNRESAYIIEPGNVQVLADKIVEVFNDLTSRVLIGENGRNVALANFSYKIQGENIASFLKKI